MPELRRGIPALEGSGSGQVEPPRQATTGQDGGFAFHQLPPTFGVLRVRASGYTDAWRIIGARGATHYTIQLHAAVTIVGRILTASGAPPGDLAGALYYTTESMDGPWQAEVESDGRFRVSAPDVVAFPVLRSTAYLLESPPAPHRLLPGTTEEIRITRRLGVRVKSGVDGAPVTDFRIGLLRDGASGRIERVQSIDGRWSFNSEFNPRPKEVWSGISVTADGFSASTHAWQVLLEAGVLEVELAPASGPVSTFQVRMAPSTDAESLALSLVRRQLAGAWSPVDQLVTVCDLKESAHGQFWCDPPPGTYLLRVAQAGRCGVIPVQAPSDESGFPLDMELLSALDVRVTGPGASEVSAFQVRSLVTLTSQTAPVIDGSGHLGWLPPGPAQVAAMGPLGTLLTPWKDVRLRAADLTGLELYVQADAAHRVVFDVAPEQAERWSWRLLRPGAEWTTLRMAREITLPLGPPVDVELRSADGVGRRVGLILTEPGETRIAVGEPKSIRLVLSDAQGSSAAFVGVELRTWVETPPLESASRTVAADGTAAIPLLAGAPQRLVVRDSTGRWRGMIVEFDPRVLATVPEVRVSFPERPDPAQVIAVGGEARWSGQGSGAAGVGVELHGCWRREGYDVLLTVDGGYATTDETGRFQVRAPNAPLQFLVMRSQAELGGRVHRQVFARPSSPAPWSVALDW
ncbi:MAG: hypothetical protein ACKN9R_06060 [Candidatus Limnocylindrus sp.]